MRAADVDNRTGIAEVVPVQEVLHAVAAVQVGVAHGVDEALLSDGLLLDHVEGVLVRVVGEREARLVRLFAAGPLLGGVHRTGDRGPEFLSDIGDPRLEHRVVEQQAGGGCMDDDALARLVEDMPSDGYAQEARDVGDVQARRLCDLGEGRLAVEGYVLRELVAEDVLYAEHEVLVAGAVDYQIQWAEQEVMELISGLESSVLRSLDLGWQGLAGVEAIAVLVGRLRGGLGSKKLEILLGILLDLSKELGDRTRIESCHCR